MAVKRAIVVAVAALALACGATSEKPGARLSRPTGIAVVQMVTAKVAGVHPYLAIANASGDELRLVDAWDDQTVLAPVAFYPLSVPTPLPRPAAVAVAALQSAGAARSEALVVAPTGAAELQLVDTWTGSPRVVQRLDLAQVVPGASILSMTGAAAAGTPAPADRARFFVGLSGRRLAVVDVQRDPASGAVSFAAFDASRVQDLGFDAVSLAFAPGDATHLYAASPDPITDSTDGRTVLGAAVLDVSAAAPPWPVGALDARAPTTLVAAFDVHERADVDVGTITIDAVNFFDFTVRRVYAALDETGCGIDRPISCGVAVLDPTVKGLRVDPATDARYAAPIPVPGVPTAIVPAGPPAQPATCTNAFAPPAAGEPPGCQYFSSDPATSAAEQRRIFASAAGVVVPMLPLAPGTGQRWTAVAAVVPSSDGSSYVVDLSRYGLPPERSFIRGPTRTRAQNPGNGPLLPTTNAPASPLIGLAYTPPPPATPVATPALLSAYVTAAIRVTPGYTPTESWNVLWQGTLPGLAARWGTLTRRDASTVVLALQVPDPSGTPGTWVDVVRVWDPALGVHAADTSPTGGDLVELSVPAMAAGTACGGDGTAAVVLTAASGTAVPIASLLQPDPAAYPGGAMALAIDAATWKCSGLAIGQSITVNASVRASGLVLVGASLGYAGRPQFGATYHLRAADEDALRTACPLVYDAPDAACDGACRSACERLVLARKARRIFYLDDACPKGSADPNGTNDPTKDPCLQAFPSGDMPDGSPGYTFPHPVGDALSFTPLRTEIDATAPFGAKFSSAAMAPDTFLRFDTDRGGAAWMTRKPLSGGSVAGAAVPVSATTFDRSVAPNQTAQGTRFLVTYPDNLVLDFAPGAGVTDVAVIR